MPPSASFSELWYLLDRVRSSDGKAGLDGFGCDDALLAWWSSTPQLNGLRSAAPKEMQAMEILQQLDTQTISALITIGGLQGHGDGTAPLSVSDSFDVRVDQDGSLVGNPFVGASASGLCLAYDDLLHVALSLDFQIERDYHSYHDLCDAYSLGAEGPRSDTQRQLLESIASRHQARVHWHLNNAYPSSLRAWLAFHARQLVGGAPLRLLSRHVREPRVPMTNHVESLAGALVWVACMHRELLRSLPFLSRKDNYGAIKAVPHAVQLPLLTSHLARSLLPSWHYP